MASHIKHGKNPFKKSKGKAGYMKGNKMGKK